MPEAPGEERRTFECRMCEHTENLLVQLGYQLRLSSGQA
jgi:hypothetical protein